MRAPEQVWTILRRNKSLALSRILTPDLQITIRVTDIGARGGAVS